MSQRKAFNLYRSYYEVAKELNEKDRGQFLWSLLQKQFEGIEPNLEGMAKFAYISQKHSIDAQVKGWEDKTGHQLSPTEPPAEGGEKPPTEPPYQQEKEKEKGQEKGKEKEKGEVAPTPPAFEKFKEYALDRAFDLNLEIDQKKLQAKYMAWKEAGWRTGKGKKIKNWKSTLLNTLNYLQADKEKSSAKKESQMDLLRQIK